LISVGCGIVSKAHGAWGIEHEAGHKVKGQGQRIKNKI